MCVCVYALGCVYVYVVGGEGCGVLTLNVHLFTCTGVAGNDKCSGSNKAKVVCDVAHQFDW